MIKTPFYSSVLCFIIISSRGAACLPSSFLTSATNPLGKAFLPCAPLIIRQHPCQGGGSWVQKSHQARTARAGAAQGLYKCIHCLNHQRSPKTKQKQNKTTNHRAIKPESTLKRSPGARNLSRHLPCHSSHILHIKEFQNLQFYRKQNFPEQLLFYSKF